MKTIWINVTGGWNFIKFIRVLAGLFILVSGISENNTIFILIGSAFLLFALLTPGVCCAMYNPSRRQETSSDIKNTEYEELGAK